MHNYIGNYVTLAGVRIGRTVWSRVGQPLQRLAKTLKLAYKFMEVFYELVNSNQPDAKDSSKLKN